MRRFESGEAVAKEMGLKTEVLKKTFDTYNEGVQNKKDAFGKKVSLLPCSLRIRQLASSFRERT